jgi:molybdate transport system regulatory protein
VQNITLGEVMSEVTVDIGGGNQLVSAITKASVERLELEVGSNVTVVVKATEVMLATE